MRKVVAAALLLGLGACLLAALPAPKEIPPAEAPPKDAPPKAVPPVERYPLHDLITLEIGSTGQKPARRHLAITPSGLWLNRIGWEKEPAERGKLRPAQVRAIAAHLAALRFDELPAHVGLPAERLADEETRYYARITLGKKTVLLISADEDFSDGAPRADDARARPALEGAGVAADKASAWSRLVALTLVLKDASFNSPPNKEALAVASIATAVARVGDDWQSIRRRYFGDDRFADALRAFNRAEPRASARMKDGGTIVPGETIHIPPADTLIGKYGVKRDAEVPPPPLPPVGVPPPAIPPVLASPTDLPAFPIPG